jgi:hypothetical protein
MTENAANYDPILNALECADQHDYETAQSAALAIRKLKTDVNRVLIENQRLERELTAITPVAVAAIALKGHLSKNVGDNADWPLRIVADNNIDAQKVAELLTDLTQAIQIYTFGEKREVENGTRKG